MLLLFFFRCLTIQEYRAACDLCTMAAAEEMSDSTKKGQFLIVGAIDFGTSYSGYAYSYSRDPTRVFRRKWFSPSRGLMVEKIPTCILFDETKQFRAFGFKAEEEYGKYCEKGKKSGDGGNNSGDDWKNSDGDGKNSGEEANNSGDEGKKRDWYFFRGYKLDLYDEMYLKETKTIKDELGREFSLFDIVTETLRYLNEELIKDCAKRQDKFTEKDLLRVITVPAIWSDSARYFMRNAAEKAGIPADLINICLEPEAAAIYCKTVPYKSDKGDGDSKLLTFEPGQKYLVFDAGGGTVDIVVHEVEESGGLKELIPACGGDWGGTMVDRAFIDFISECLGEEAVSKFRRTETYDFMDLMREFENKKRSVDIKYSTDAKVLFRVPISLQDIYRASFSEGQYQHTGSKDFSLKKDKMRLKYESVLSLFSHSKERIRKKLLNLFTQGSLIGVDTIIMVGGYSDSLVLQNFMFETFKTKTVIVANEPATAVLQGAVMFGHDPSIIAERRCRYTYGIKCTVIFEPIKHKASKRFTDEDGLTRAKDAFDVHVKVGQNVKPGVFQQFVVYTPQRKDQTLLNLQLYASLRPDPLHTDDEDCKEINSRSINISDLQGATSEREVQVSLCFSEPLISVKAVKKQTGEEITHKVQYNWSIDDTPDNAVEAALIRAMKLGASTCSCSLAFQNDPSGILTIPLSFDIENRSRQLLCILFDKKQNFTAFGFEAKEKYDTIKDRENWFFFKDFKNVLYGNKCIDRKTTVKDVLGKDFVLFKIIKETIRYLKTKVCDNCKSTNSNTPTGRYVLSVPNTFTDSVRQFLVEAALEAEIPRQQLLLCSEADAVVAYCQSVFCQCLSGSVKVGNNSILLDPTQTYVVCIAGNHWVSFTAIKVDDKGHVKASRDMGSGEWGLSMACDSFSKFLHDVVGDKVMAEAEQSEKEELRALMNDFRTKCRSLSRASDITNNVSFKMPPVIPRKASRRSFKAWQRRRKFINEVTFVGDKMRISQMKMLEFHMDSLEKLKFHLLARLVQPSINAVSAIILVGDYAECLVLQEYFAKIFQRKTIIVPEMPSEAVSRGAILHVYSCDK